MWSFWKHFRDPYYRPLTLSGGFMVLTLVLTYQMSTPSQETPLEGFLLERTPATAALPPERLPETTKEVPLYVAIKEESETPDVHAAAPVVDDGPFPEFDRAVFPVSSTPDWGKMRSPAEWERKFGEYTEEEIVPVPTYDRAVLTTPLIDLTKPLNEENLQKITAKLFYSTRYFGAYDIDAEEFTGPHPGIDIKLPEGTPIGAIAGGRVVAVSSDRYLGLHIIIEHRINEETFYSIYGHFGSVQVDAGDAVKPGQTIGTVGMTGNTVAPHLHLQIDKDTGETPHLPYRPTDVPTRATAEKYAVHPMSFIQEHSSK